MNVWHMRLPTFSPEQKMEVYRAVREGEIDLFYLSPELLLSYDIRHFIGNRRIGMVVVDEAHTVTTWGKKSSAWTIGFWGVIWTH